MQIFNQDRTDAEAAAQVAAEQHARAVAELRAAFVRCEQGGIDRATVNAVLIAELLPRLVEAYGPLGVAGVLGQLASHIVETHTGANQTRQ
jgi:hypothetical protein